MTRKETVLGWAGLVLTFVLWGSLYVVSVLLLKSLPTFFVAAARFVVAFVTLSAILAVKKRRPPSPAAKQLTLDKKAMRYVAVLGFFGYTVSVGTQLIGTKLAGSSTASLINALNPIAISLFAVWLLKEKLTAAKIVGILLAVAGVYAIFGGGQVQSPLGVVLSLAAVCGWALTSVLTRRGLADYDPIAVTRGAAGICMIGNLILCAGELLFTHAKVTLTLGSILGLLYMGICCTGLAYVFWNRGLSLFPASSCSALYPVQPFTSALLGVLIFHERPGLGFLLGSVLILCGVLISLLWDTRKSRRASS